MDNNSMDKQLYDFLSKYNLIQSTLEEEQAREKIVLAMEELEEEENILTGFLAGLEAENPESDRAFLITESERIVLSPDENHPQLTIDVNEIESIDVGDGFNKSKVIIRFSGENLELLTQSEEGAESINDALYTALTALLPSEKTAQIFDMEPEEVEEVEEISDEEPELEESEEEQETEPEDIAQTIPEMDIIDVDEEKINEINEPAASIEKTAELSEVPVPAAADNMPELNEPAPPAVQPIETTSEKPEKESTGEELTGFKKLMANKPLFYGLGAVAIILLCVAGFSLFRSISQNAQTNQNASELVGILNEIDDIYYKASEYQQAGAGGSTPEQWQELDNKALEVQNKLNEFTPNEPTDSLYQAIYFYNDALMTALYYGQSFATTGNPLQQSTLEQRLNSAYQNRLAALSFIESDFPDLEDDVTHQTDLSEESVAFPQQQEAQQLQEEANSKPTDDVVNKAASESSNEAQDNSSHSRENQDAQQSQQ